MAEDRRRQMSREELNALLMANHRKVEELAKAGARLEEIDLMSAMYIAGRLDGVTDALMLQKRSA